MGQRRHTPLLSNYDFYSFKAKTTTCAATVLLFEALTYQVAPGNGTPSCPISTRPIQVRKDAAARVKLSFSPGKNILSWLTILFSYIFLDSKGGSQDQVFFPWGKKVPDPSSDTDAHRPFLPLRRQPAVLGRRAGPTIHSFGGGMLELLQSVRWHADSLLLCL